MATVIRPREILMAGSPSKINYYSCSVDMLMDTNYNRLLYFFRFRPSGFMKYYSFFRIFCFKYFMNPD